MQNKSSIGPNNNTDTKRGYFDDSECFPKVVPETLDGPQKYLPEIWSIEKDLIYKIIPCLEAGLENTQSALDEHDITYGRTITKNKIWAETLEQEIRDMEDCIKQLKVMNAGNSTHYP